MTRRLYVVVVSYDSADDGSGTDALEVFTSRRRAERFAFGQLRAMPEVGEVRRMRRNAWIGYPRVVDRHGATTEVTGYANVYERWPT